MTTISRLLSRLLATSNSALRHSGRRDLAREVEYLGGRIVWDSQPPPLKGLEVEFSNPTNLVAYRGLVVTEVGRDRLRSLDNLCAIRLVCRDLLSSYGEPGDPRWRYLDSLLKE